MVTKDPYRRVTLGSFGLGGPVPRDLIVLLAVLFATFSLRFFETTAWIPRLLELAPAVWSRLQLWRLPTYPFIGSGGSGLWFLVSLLILYMFGRDVFYGLGRRHFWRMILWSGVGAGVVAVLTDILMPPAFASPYPYILMQGQTILATIFVAAFATARGDATILLFFILPIQARWFLGLEILFGFMGFLSTHDLPGFLGICSAVGLSYGYLRSRGSISGGRRSLRELRLRLERWWIQRKLERARQKRGFRVIPGEGKRDPGSGTGSVRKGPWVN